MGLTHVTVRLRNFAGPNGGYEADFLVDTGATDSLASAAELRKAGIQPIGQTAYELTNGRLGEYEFGLAEISFMGEVTAGRVIFGPDNVASHLEISFVNPRLAALRLLWYTFNGAGSG